MSRIQELLVKAERREDFVWSKKPIEARWREKYGWIPPSEDPKYQKKWAYYKSLAVQD